MTKIRRNTEHLIETAILRFQKERTKLVVKGRKISIKSVAEEADISPATIHNRYPELADKIRKLSLKTTSEQLRSRRIKQENIKERTKKLRAEVIQLKNDLAKAMSINLRLQKENDQLKVTLSLLQKEKES